MAVELKVPEVGESISEVQIGQWLIGEGQSVQRDEGVVELESDKATLDLPAPVSGVVSKVVKKSGEKAAVGEVIGYIEEKAVEASKSGGDGKDAAVKKEPEQKKEASAPPVKAEPTTEKRETSDSSKAVPFVMPAARRVLKEHGISEEEIEGTGPGGRILKDDVLRYVKQQSAEKPEEPKPEMTQPVSEPSSAPQAQGGIREEEAIPMSPLRKTIAQRLVQAQQTAALLTTFNEVDMTGVMALRQQHRDAFQKNYDIKLGFMSFFVKACVDALKRFPAVNAEVRNDEIVYKNYCDIGIAVGGGKGLVVPILRNAELMSFAEIEAAIQDFAVRAKDNKIGLEELKGGSFSISNGGIYGSMLSTPIVNPPQSGILGLHAIQERPVARDGEVVVRPMMYVALTYDHRVVDGREAVSFLVRIKECVEDPARMLLEI